MRTVVFESTDKEIFYNLYLAFITSRKSPESVAEIGTATDVLTKLKDISEEPPGAPENNVARVLKEEGGEMKLEEIEFSYLATSVYPPNSKWTHQGLDVLSEIKTKLDAVEKE